MIEVCNKLFQPLTLQTKQGTGLHLSPRASARLPEAEVSDEMRRAAGRGFITLRPVATNKADAKAAAKAETKEG